MCGSEPDAPKASPYEKEMLKQAENRIKEYHDTYVPIEKAMMKKNRLYGSDAYKTKKQNEAVAGAKMANSGATVAGVGMQPGSGGFLMGSQDMSNASGEATGLANAAGGQVALDKQYGGALDVVKLGRHQTATSADLNSTLASNAAGVQAAQFRAAHAERNAMYGAAGTAVGMGGMAAYNKWSIEPEGTKNDPP